MNLVSYALTTLNDVKTFLGISSTAHDEVLKFLINQATDYIETFTGRRYTSTTYTQEEYDGTGTSELRLKHFPVVTFTLLEVNRATDNSDDWATIDAEDYWVNSENGIVTLQSGFLDYDEVNETGLSPNIFQKSKNKYRATYTAGYTTVPYDLQYACCMIVSETFNVRKAAGIQSESLGDHSVTFGNLLEKSTTLKNILSGYKDYEI